MAAAAPPKTGILGDISKLALGTITAQVIGVLAAPLIARMFSPEAFGGLALFAAVSGTVSVISCWCYEHAILIPESDEEAGHVLWLCAALVLMMTAATGVLLLIAGPWLWRLVHAPELHKAGLLVMMNVAVAGCYSVLYAWNTRQRQFGRLTAVSVVTRVSITGAQIIVALAGFAGTLTLIASTVFGLLASTLVLAVGTYRDSSTVLRLSFAREPIVTAFRRYCRFPKFSIGATLLNSTSGHLPIPLLSAFFSVGVAGQWAMGSRLLRIPAQLIGDSFSRAFFPRAAEARIAGNLGPAVETAIVNLIKISAFPCLLLTVIGKPLFVAVLGARWGQAGVFAQILSVWLFTWFVSSPLNTVLVVLEEQALELRFQAVNFASRLLALLVGGLLGSPIIAAVLFSVCGMCVYGCYCGAVIHKSGADPRPVLSAVATSLTLFVPAAALVMLIRHYTLSNYPPLAMGGVLLVAYFLHLLQVDPAARQVLGKVSRKLFPAVN
jgi:O-antigen/teichoic acid export membrane protein